MSGISVGHAAAEHDDPTKDEPPLYVKIAWGSLIGLIAWIMVSFAGEGKDKGLEGVKILSNLGGFPALILMIFVAWGMVKLMLNPGKLE